jgi:hypothetical protein
MPRPEMIHVRSSNVEAVGYDSSELTLYVRYLDGSEYAYYGVPEFIYDDLLSTNSIGSYLHVYVKNQYSYKKVG